MKQSVIFTIMNCQNVQFIYSCTELKPVVGLFHFYFKAAFDCPSMIRLSTLHNICDTPDNLWPVLYTQNAPNEHRFDDL